MAGGENHLNLASRQVMRSVSAFRHGRDVEQESDEAIEQLLSHVPEMSMAPDCELGERRVNLDRELQRCSRRRCRSSRESSVNYPRHVNAFRRALRGDPPVKVESTKVELKPGARLLELASGCISPPKARGLQNALQR